MKILTAISLISSLLTPLTNINIKNDKVLVGTTSNNMIDVSYLYGVEYVDMNTTYTSTSSSNDISCNFYCDMVVNIHGEYSGTVRINYTSPNSSAPSDYKINYVIYGCNATSTTIHNDYINVRIPDGANEFTVRFYFNWLTVTYYGLNQNSTTDINWINQTTSNNMYFEPLSVSNSLVSIQNADDYEIDYTSILNGSLYDNDGNGICYYLDDIAIDTGNIYAELVNMHQDMITSVQSYKTLTFANVPEYSYTAYSTLAYGRSLKYDGTLPKPYFTTSNNSSSAFSWNDAIQVGQGINDLVIAFVTYSTSLNVQPSNFKVIKSNGTDVSNTITWSNWYVGRFKMFYATMPTSLYNNAINIKWNASFNVMPVYVGRLSNMPFECAELMRIDSNNQLIRELEKINNSINGLDDVTVDTQDKTNVDTEYNSNLQELNQTIQGITLPSMTDKDKGMFNYLTGFYLDIINDDSMRLYKYGIIITIVSAVIKVIL